MKKLYVAFLGIIQLFASLDTGSSFTCDTECFDAYLQFSTITCDIVTAALNCYNNHLELCTPPPFYYFLAMNYNIQFGCDTAPIQTTSSTQSTTSTSTSTTIGQPNPVSCPSLPEMYNETHNPLVAMSQAVILPRFSSPQCSMSHVPALAHCSLFMDSQLRAFGTYRNGLEACSLPGTWYLLLNDDLSIEVEGSNMEAESNHTRLTKINVTFHSHECNSLSRTYTAYNLSPLPSEFTPPLGPSETHTSPLDLVSAGNGSVVTLFATWLNATIVIRQYAGLLSITLQVPEEMSLRSEGLCTGCPAHSYINMSEFIDSVPLVCQDDHNRALFNCFDHAGVTNQGRSISRIKNNSYFDACMYSMHKIKSPDVLSMFRAIASDAKLLRNRMVPVPMTIAPPPVSTQPPPQSSTHTRILTPTIPTSNYIVEMSSSISFHSPILRIWCITILTLLSAIGLNT